MSLSLSQIAIPAFVQGLDALSATLAKAEQHAATRKIDEAAFLQARLYPDMFALTRQVQIVTDFAKGAAARLAGVEVPSYPDDETSFAALRARIARTLEFCRSVSTAAVDGSQDRDITVKGGSRTLSFRGDNYLLGFVLPNFYFHCATAYGLLRHNGVELGKSDYAGDIRMN